MRDPTAAPRNHATKRRAWSRTGWATVVRGERAHGEGTHTHAALRCVRIISSPPPLPPPPLPLPPSLATLSRAPWRSKRAPCALARAMSVRGVWPCPSPGAGEGRVCQGVRRQRCQFRIPSEKGVSFAFHQARKRCGLCEISVRSYSAPRKIPGHCVLF